ncbi:caveolae-associated protein 2a [Denticeps clupeoides]|uniref:Uncharacterized protein n=1 Tax=Denticeps clupeoides TaxID=299321 RepID=A0AAY4B7W6_9TELE|nr:caveolae-associated protein 2 [Denticeps clupeoides]XP_028847558.1 caveolae-associated protein 2 [Denticeps clupeoides]XP_028847559.1 caveolae-associated protein 2 [Denticeps clupeoides]
MGEDSSRALARTSATLPPNLSLSAETQEPPLLVPSFSANSAPSSPGGTLSRLGLKSPTSPSSPGGSGGGQVSAITVVALLDKLVAMMESVQDNQQRAEKKQVELEAVVRGVQGDVTRLAKNHANTANSVNKLLERSRKTSGHVKEVRERLDRQGVQVKRLEANHAHLLKRNHFKVIIYQEDNEIPSTLMVKDPGASSMSHREGQDEASILAPTPTTDANRSQEEGLHTISLTSDEEDDETSVVAAAAAVASVSSPRSENGAEHHVEDDDILPGADSERFEWSRTEKLKRSSLKKVDSLKKAFSRQSIEKKFNKIVPPERREKIKKSFTPNHPKSPTSKSSSFRVSPMTFNVKKVRDTDASPEVQVEVPALGEGDGEFSTTEVHTHVEKEDIKSPSSSSSMEGGASVNEEVDPENDLTPATLAEEEVLPEQDEEDDEEEEEEEQRLSPTEPDTTPVATAVAVEQAS